MRWFVIRHFEKGIFRKTAMEKYRLEILDSKQQRNTSPSIKNRSIYIAMIFGMTFEQICNGNQAFTELIKI